MPLSVSYEDFVKQQDQPTIKVTPIPSSMLNNPKIVVTDNPNSTPGNLQGGSTEIQGSQVNPQPAIKKPVLQNTTSQQNVFPTTNPNQLKPIPLNVTGVNGTPASKPTVEYNENGEDLNEMVQRYLDQPMFKSDAPSKYVLNPAAKFMAGILTTIATPVYDLTQSFYSQHLLPTETLGGQEHSLSTPSSLEPDKLREERAVRENLLPVYTDANGQTRTVLNDLPINNKTPLQVAGDIAQAVLTVAAPEIGSELIGAGFTEAAAKQTLAHIFIKGAAKGALDFGLPFGVAQALSSGTKDPKEFSKIVLENVGYAALFSGATESALPALGKGVEKVKQIRSQIEDLQNGVEKDLISKGYAPDRAKALAKNGGYVNITGRTTPEAPEGFDLLLDEAKKYNSADEFKQAVRDQFIQEGKAAAKDQPEIFYTNQADRNIANLEKQLGQNLDEVYSQATKGVGQKIVDLAESKYTPYNKRAIDIDAAQPKTVEVVKKATGLDVSDYTHQVDNYGLRHALTEHSNDPVPLTIQDFEKIPDIISNPDSVKISKKTRGGLDAIRYKKTYDSATYYVEEIRTGQKTLSMKTMYKTKTPAGASYAPEELRAVRPSSEGKTTTPGGVLGSTVADETGGVKLTKGVRVAYEDKEWTVTRDPWTGSSGTEFVKIKDEQGRIKTAKSEDVQITREAISNKALETGGNVKKQIAQGIAREKPVVVSRPEDVVLREKLRAEAKGAKSGFKAGYAEARESIISQLRNKFENQIADTERKGELKLLKEKILDRNRDRIKGEINDYIKDTLPASERGKFITMVKNAETQKDLVKAFVRVDQHAQDIQLKQAVSDLAEKVKKLSSSPGIDIEYAGKIKDVVDGFELEGHSEKTMEKLKATQEYIKQQKAAGKEVAMPERIMEKLQILTRVPKDKLTISQVEALGNEVDLLAQLGKTKLKSRQAIYDYEKDLRSQQIQQEAVNFSPKEMEKAPIGEKLPLKTRVVNAYNKAYNLLVKKNMALTPIDGLAKVTGMSSVKEALDLDFSNYLSHDLKTTVLEQRQKLLDKLKLDDSNMERIGAYAVAQQESGYEKLANLGITREEIDAIKLTPEETEYYNFVRKTFDDWFQPVKDYMKEVYNQDVGKVNNYVSFITDFDAMDDLEVYDRFGTLADDAMSRRTKTVEKGFTESRKGAGTQKIQINIDKIFLRHTDDVAYMLNMGKDIKMFSEIVNTPEVAEKMGGVSNLTWKQYLDLMARKGGTTGAQRIRALDIIRRNLGASVLPFKVSSALIQLSNFADGASVLGGDYMFIGAKNIATSKEWRQFVMDNFPEIRASVGDDPAFLELNDSWLGSAAEKGMAPLKALDGLARTSTAAGAYEKLMAEAGKTVDLANPDKEIIAKAQKLVRKGQGSSLFKDQPLAITAGGLTGNKSLDKLILQFQSFMLHRWDNIKDQIWREGIAKGNYKQATTGAFWLLGVAGAIEVSVRSGTTKLLNLITGNEDSNTDSFVSQMASNSLQTIPFMGSLGNSVLYGSNPVPAINTIENTYGGLSSVYSGKTAKTKLKGAAQTAGAAGNLLGVPGSTQGADIIRRAIGNKKSGSDGEVSLPELNVDIPELKGIEMPELNIKL